MLKLNEKEIEEKIEDLAIAMQKEDGESLWRKFLPQHLKLHMAKQILNYTAPRLNSLIPDRKPEYIESQIINNTFMFFRDVIKKNDVEKRWHEDGNFPQFLESTRRLLIFLCEEDIYYRKSLSVFLMLLALQVSHYQNQIGDLKQIKIEEK